MVFLPVGGRLAEQFSTRAGCFFQIFKLTMVQRNPKFSKLQKRHRYMTWIYFACRNQRVKQVQNIAEKYQNTDNLFVISWIKVCHCSEILKFLRFRCPCSKNNSKLISHSTILQTFYYGICVRILRFARFANSSGKGFGLKIRRLISEYWRFESRFEILFSNVFRFGKQDSG